MISMDPQENEGQLQSSMKEFFARSKKIKEYETK